MQAYHQPMDYFVWEISYTNLVLLQLDSIDHIHKDKDGKLPGSGNMSDVMNALQKEQEKSEKAKEAQRIIDEALARKRAKEIEKQNEKLRAEREQPHQDNGEEVLNKDTADN